MGISVERPTKWAEFSLGRAMVLVAAEPVRCKRSAKSMVSPLRFPTELHREVSELVKDFFSAHAHVDTDPGGELVRARPGCRRQRSGFGGADHACRGKPGGSILDYDVAGVHCDSAAYSPVPEHR